MPARACSPSEFHAELVAVAGVFKVFEQLPADLAGQPVQALLAGEDLRFARLDELNPSIQPFQRKKPPSD